MEEPPSKDESNAPAGAQNPNHLFGGVDSISSLPDKMLHHILSFVPTNVAITTNDSSKYPSKDDYQVMMQTMLENLQNVEKLTVVLSFLQMLSVAEFHGVPFPTLKVKTFHHFNKIIRYLPRYNFSWASTAQASLKFMPNLDMNKRNQDACPILFGTHFLNFTTTCHLDGQGYYRLDLYEGLNGTTTRKKLEQFRLGMYSNINDQ
ncbi:hypothetical protein Bca4012_042724 [Brassica carinata]